MADCPLLAKYFENFGLGYHGGKWVPEIEILKFGRDSWVQFSRSDAQKRAFLWLPLRHFGQSDFCNRIDL